MGARAWSVRAAKRLNRRKAIRRKCLDCSGGSYKEVRDCPHVECPLHHFRMGTEKQDPVARARAIRLYCVWCSGDQRGVAWRCNDTGCWLHPYRKVRLDNGSLKTKSPHVKVNQGLLRRRHNG